MRAFVRRTWPIRRVKSCARADETGCQIVLPSDVVIAAGLEEGIATEVVPIAAVLPDLMILDVGQDQRRAESAFGELRHRIVERTAWRI